MRISQADWLAYIGRLAKIDSVAAEKVSKWVETNGLGDLDALTDYAYAVATKYGEASAALAAEMYDATAAAAGVAVPTAEVAATATYDDVARAIHGTAKCSENPNYIGNSIGRLVKRAGADTTLKNAERDGAQFAWIPMGDTCAFCLTLASRGWQYMSKKAMKGGHAEHIHANCDCTYAVRFDGRSSVQGYNPDKYLKMYYGAEGSTPKDRINAMRRANYALKKDEINAQKREAYAKRNIGDEYGGIPKKWGNLGKVSNDKVLNGTNPNYITELPSYLVGTKDDYTYNCANCVAAYEMRKRGYDVTACSVGENKGLKKNPFAAWKGRSPQRTTGDGLDDILEFMNNADEGTRIEISILYKPLPFTTSSTGHAFVAEKNAGKTVFVDPQSGKIIDKKIFDNALKNDTMFMRIDDLEVSDRGVTACKKV